uniref:ABC transporter domain-containing protein n=1 Tax=Glossina brevipalpis TaxID=37001 RepID=A0A1A9WM80_9MUSC
MGPSGSGKTTLLDCLSGQRHIDSGAIFLNREPLSKKWRRKICYVLQEEIFFSGLTLRETVWYTALLRLPEKMPKSQKITLVDGILEALDLTFCQHTKFGDYMNRGLSGGEKKRANIACELLTNPLLMLLDVNSIYRYFEDIGVVIEPHYNPAEFVLEQLKSHPDVREKLFIAARESHGNFLNRNCIACSNHKKNTLNNNKMIQNETTGLGIEKSGRQHDALINDIINNYYKDQQEHTDHHVLMNQSPCEEVTEQLWCGGDSQSNFSSLSSDSHNCDWLDYPTRFYAQFSVLSNRNFKEAKSRMLSKLNWFQTIGLALMAGAIWFNIPRTEEYLHDLQGWMFFSQTYWMLFALFGALNSFPSEREVINKERRSGSYRLSAYYLAKMFGELPLVVTLPTVYLTISYPMLGCSSLKLFSLMLIFLLLNTIVAQSVGFFIGACCMDMNVSITLSALYTLATQLFGGYLTTRIPEYLNWIRYTSMIHYAYQNMQILEFREGLPIECSYPSSYEVCKNNATAFISYKEILKAQNSTSPLWVNTLVLMMFFLVFRGLGYAVLRYIRCPKT